MRFKFSSLRHIQVHVHMLLILCSLTLSQQDNNLHYLFAKVLAAYFFQFQYKPASHNKGKLEFENIRLKQELNRTVGNESVSGCG